MFFKILTCNLIRISFINAFLLYIKEMRFSLHFDLEAFEDKGTFTFQYYLLISIFVHVLLLMYYYT